MCCVWISAGTGCLLRIVVCATFIYMAEAFFRAVNKVRKKTAKTLNLDAI